MSVLGKFNPFSTHEYSFHISTQLQEAYFLDHNTLFTLQQILFKSLLHLKAQRHSRTPHSARFVPSRLTVLSGLDCNGACENQV
jgi:hypothetical protein